MVRICIQTPILLSFLLVLLFFISNCFASSQNNDDDKRIRVRVGLVLDLGSVEGKIVRSSVSMALSDFYDNHNDYKTRLSLLVRDSHGEPLLALASGNILHYSCTSLYKSPFSLYPFLFCDYSYTHNLCE